jgi:hypothetical protein
VSLASTAPAPGSLPSATIVPVLSEAHRAAERELLAHAETHVLSHRVDWLERRGGASALFCAARDLEGRCRAGFAIDVAPSRALPGHQLLRVERFTPPADAALLDAMLSAISAWAESHPRVLRVSLELHSLDPARRVDAEARLAAHGFRRAKESRSYEHTLVLDLAPDEAAIYQAFHSSARKNLKAAANKPVQVQPVVDPAWAPRLDVLLGESMSRTGGVAGRHDWEARIDFGRRLPGLSRIVGLFRTDATGPESLLSFAWACHHGSYAHYDASGATRSSGLKVPMAYPLLWDLIRWAKAGGARWFDFGGVTFGHLRDGEDRLGGISDFKRFFTDELVEVGAEWVLEPRPLRAHVARAAGALAARLRGLRGR